MSSKINKNDIIEKIKSVSSIKDLESVRLYYIGKKGLITLEMKSLSSLSVEEKKLKGKTLNSIKVFLEEEIKKKKK